MNIVVQKAAENQQNTKTQDAPGTVSEVQITSGKLQRNIDYAESLIHYLSQQDYESLPPDVFHALITKALDSLHEIQEN